MFPVSALPTGVWPYTGSSLNLEYFSVFVAFSFGLGCNSIRVFKKGGGSVLSKNEMSFRIRLLGIKYFYSVPTMCFIVVH